MSQNNSPQQDPDMQNATAALLRAAQKARQLAAQTGTEIVVMRDGKLIREIPNAERIAKIDDENRD